MRQLTALALLLVLTVPALAAEFDATVRDAQQALTDRGFEPGPVDGLMGRRTRAAIVAFQKGSGLGASGKLDAATTTALGLAPAPARKSAAPPAASAPAPAVPAPAASTVKTPQRLAPSRAPRHLSYTKLGWSAPATAAEVAARSKRTSGITEVTTRPGELLVSDVDSVFLLRSGERLAGEPCRPNDGEPTMEFLVGPDGPVSFVSERTAPLCQLGTGVVLSEGMTLRMIETWWGDTRVPAGRVRIGARGLEYLR